MFFVGRAFNSVCSTFFSASGVFSAGRAFNSVWLMFFRGVNVILTILDGKFGRAGGGGGWGVGEH